MRLLPIATLLHGCWALVAPPRGLARVSATVVSAGPFSRGEGAAAGRVRAYFEAWNARDMDLACAQWCEDCVYEDTQYAGAFEGKAALEEHLFKVADALPSSFAFSIRAAAYGCPAVLMQ